MQPRQQTPAPHACSSPTAGDAGLVGVFAQLVTVDDRQLSAVLAASQRGNLAVVVVADAAARQRVAAALARDKYAAPDMLPMTNMLPWSGKAGDSPGFAGANERAHALQRAACRGVDAPLAMPLPHTARMGQLREKGGWVGKGREGWVAGPSLYLNWSHHAACRGLPVSFQSRRLPCSGWARHVGQ